MKSVLWTIPRSPSSNKICFDLPAQTAAVRNGALQWVYLKYMRLVGVVLQNKKGENVVMATSNGLSSRQAVMYSSLVYEHILETYRRRLRIERTLVLEPNLLCVLSINKDFILYVFVARMDLGLAFEAVKKATEFINSNAKLFGGTTGSAKLEAMSRKLVECMGAFEEFLYTRDIALKEYMPLQPQPSSRRKGPDHDVLNKFTHISSDMDRKVILSSHLFSAGIEAIEGKRRARILQQGRKLAVKSQDDCDLLQADPEKEQFVTQYMRQIARLATCGRRQMAAVTLADLSLSALELAPEELLEQEGEDEPEREKVKLKMNEKLELSLQNAKIKEVQQFGQLAIEGTQKEEVRVELLDYLQFWNNPKYVSRRVSPSAAGSVEELEGGSLKIKTEAGYRSKAVLDYILRKESFGSEKVPLLFVYNREVGSSNVEFTFKYKVNEKWKHRLYDIDISVYLHREFLVMDCKSVPSAYSLKNNKITWKTKEIIPQAANSKGKIILAFGSTNLPPPLIITHIKLSMKASCGLLDPLSARCCQEWGNVVEAEKSLLIEYKVAPNDEA